MIPASEALKLPSAQLTDEEKAAVERMESEIDEGVRTGMEHRGIDLNFTETNGNVIAEVNQRVKKAGFNAQWIKLVQKHKFNAALTETVGYSLSLSPTDEAYQTEARLLLS